MSFIVGNDVSSFQGEFDWDTYSKNSNFLIAKATEGIGFIDPQYGFNRENARSHNLPFGSYHFARPDLGNSPQDEAKAFCAVIDGDPIREGELLALDFEVTYNDPVGWSKQWLDAVCDHFNGLKPLIYLNQYLATNYDWTEVADAGYGLWIAAYTYDPGNNQFQTGAFKFAAMQQWTDKQAVPGINGNLDGDVFFGDVTQLKSYGYKSPQPIAQTSTQNNQVPQTTQQQQTPVAQANQGLPNGFLQALIDLFNKFGIKF